MLSKIIDGICLELKTQFGDGYEIYPEAVRQGLKEPCFFVQLVRHKKTSHVGTKQVGKSYKLESSFCITFIPESTNKAMLECCEAVDILQFGLEEITVDGDLVIGTDMHSETVDNTLHFFVDYNMFVRQKNEVEPMEELKKNIGMKG